MDAVEVPLTQGFVAVIDEADAEAVLAHKWCAMRGSPKRQIVAVRGMRLPDGRQRLQYLHRFLMGLEHGDPREVNHRDFDPLNNRRSNLEIVTGRQNKQYQPSRGGSSAYIGVTWDATRSRWRSQIQVDGKVLNLGRFATEEEAAAARDDYVVKHGLHHKLNEVA